MAEDNRPTGREKNVTGPGKGVYKRGDGLGTGPVGSGSGMPGGSGQGGNNRPTRSGGGFKMPLIVAVIVALLGGGGALSGLFGVQDTTPAPVQQSDKATYVVHSLSELMQLQNMLSGSAASGSSGYTSSSAGSSGTQYKPSQTGSAANTVSSWQKNANNGVLNTKVAAGARSKFTKLKGGGKDTVTVMVWMCGADLESKNGMASLDIQEMASANLDANDNVKVILCTGGSKKWHIQGISNSAHQVYRVVGNNLSRLLDNYGSGYMTDPKNLQDFIQLCAQNFPADRNILVFWDHGGGSLSGYGYDELNRVKDTMNLSEINSALKGAGVKFDMIGFDTCLMATAENALMLSNYADYMVASEETEPGYGWNYTGWLNALVKNTSASTLEIGKTICDDFIVDCNKAARGQKATLSVVDLAELSGTMKGAFMDFSSSTSDLIQSNNYKVVSNARSNTREFAPSPIDQIDLVHFANNLGTPEAKALSDALLSAIKYNRASNISNAYGLSIYFPYRAKASNVNAAVNIYDGIGLDDEYSECIKNFAGMAASGQAVAGNGQQNTPYSVLSGTGSSSSYTGNSAQDVLQLLNLFMGGSTATSSQNYSSGYNTQSYSANPMGLLAGQLLSTLLTSRSMPVEDTARYIAENSFDATNLKWTLFEDDQFRLILSQDQWDLVQGLDLNMYYDDGEGYIDLGLDNVYEFDKYGNLLGKNDGSWVSINQQPVAYYHLSTSEETDGTYSITGYVPAMLNGERVKLMLIFDSANPYGYVAGAQPVYDIDTEAKGLIEIQDGDKIDFLCDYYSYSGNYQDSYMLGDQLTVNGPLTISNTLVGDGTLAMYRFTDIYGQYYWTEAIPEAK